MITFVIVLVAVLIVVAALWYAINALAPEPIGRFLKVAIIVIGAIFIAYLLLGLSPDTVRFR